MKKKGTNRIQRVAELIQTTLAEILQHEKEDLQVGMLTVTGVTVSPDFSHAKVFVSVLDAEKAKETIDKLNKATKHLRHLLAHSIKLRVTPVLRFVYDDSLLRGSHISSLINQALQDKHS